jgi:hypothetical protein
MWSREAVIEPDPALDLKATLTCYPSFDIISGPRIGSLILIQRTNKVH